MHREGGELDFIKKSISKYYEEDLPVKIEQPLFINKIGPGKLSYLHKIFPGCSDNDIEKIENSLGFKLPFDYILFMKFTNGCILFDNSLHIYGTKSNSNRSLLIDEQTSVSLFEEIDHAESSGVNYGDDWSTIGSVSGSTERFNIDINEDGEARLISEQLKIKVFSSFRECLETIVALILEISNSDGLSDETGIELQKEMNSVTTGLI